MLEISTFGESDWPQLKKLYQDGIETNQATFELQAPEWPEFDSSHLDIGRLKATSHDRIVGWVALSPVSRRPAYAGVAEYSIYIAENSRGTGVGKQLMARLIELSEAKGIWTLQASTFPENIASLKLQEKFGFRVVGTRKKIAQQHGVWRDTIITERRIKTD